MVFTDDESVIHLIRIFYLSVFLIGVWRPAFAHFIEVFWHCYQIKECDRGRICDSQYVMKMIK